LSIHTSNIPRVPRTRPDRLAIGTARTPFRGGEQWQTQPTPSTDKPISSLVMGNSILVGLSSWEKSSFTNVFHQPLLRGAQALGRHFRDAFHELIAKLMILLTLVPQAGGIE